MIATFKDTLKFAAVKKNTQWLYKYIEIFGALLYSAKSGRAIDFDRL